MPWAALAMRSVTLWEVLGFSSSSFMFVPFLSTSRHFLEQPAPALDLAGVDAGHAQLLPDYRGYRVVEGNTGLALEFLGKLGGAQVGAEGGDRLRAAPGHLAHHGAPGVFGHFGEIEIDRDAQVLLGRYFDAEGGVVGDDARLDVGQVGRGEAQLFGAGLGQDLVQGEDRGGGGDAGGFGDAAAQLLVAIPERMEIVGL